MEIVLFYAQGTNGAFGLKNRIPWKVPEDLENFKKFTMGHAVFMGRRTWESLPASVRPLPGRMNLVLTSVQEHRREEDVWTIDEALDRAKKAGHTRFFVIGGPSLIQAMESRAHRLIITNIPYNGPFDVRKPDVDMHNWTLQCVSPVSVERNLQADIYLPVDKDKRYVPTMKQRFFRRLMRRIMG